MRMHELLSTTEAATLLGVSRVSVFNMIKTGKIPAEKVGRNYVIQYADLQPYLKKQEADTCNIPDTLQRREIDSAVKKTVSEYGETLKLLQNA